MRYIFSALLASFLVVQSSAQLNLTFLDRLEYDFSLNDIWGYSAPNGDEYALVGTRMGLSIVDINGDTLRELDFIPGQNSTWRDIKTWKDYAYVSTEQSDGLLVVDLKNLPDSTSHFFWQPELEPNRPLLRIHNIFIDEYGILYISGARGQGSQDYINNGGVILVDVDTNPGQPEFISFGEARYSHDAYARDSILYSSDINDGTLSIYDIHNPENITLEGRVITPSEFTHNAWLSDDSETVFTTDERPNAFIAAYDITDFGDIKEIDRFQPAATLGQGVVPHNVHVWDDWLIISYYTDGCILVDAARPDNLIEVGNFDTFLPDDPDNTGIGAWGAYPFLPSGKVLVSDAGNGLYVLEPNYVRAAYLEGTVKGRYIDSLGNEVVDDLINAQVTIIADEILEPTLSQMGGIFKTGKAIPGTFTVEISVDGFDTWTGEVIFENGVVTILDVILNGDGVNTSTKNNAAISEAISVYPNPANDHVQIDMSDLQLDIEQISITNSIGQVMASFQNSIELTRFSVAQWDAGVYFVRLAMVDGSFGVKSFTVVR